MPVAIERARAAGCPPVTPRDTVIIGDTPLDVACAREAGIRCVGVATGGFSADALLAAGADAVFDTFADTDAVVGGADGTRGLKTPGYERACCRSAGLQPRRSRQVPEDSSELRLT